MRLIGTGILCLLTLASWSVPYLMRRDMLFGVTVSSEIHDTGAARRIIQLYQLRAYLCGFAVIMLGIMMPGSDHLGWRWAIPLVLFLLGSSIAFGQAHNASRRHAVAASGVREAELLPQAGSRVESPWMLLLGPAILAVGFAVVFSIADQTGRVPLFAGWDAIVARWTAIGQLVGKELSFTLGASIGSLLPLLAFRFGSRRGPSGIVNYRIVILRSIIIFNSAFALLAVWVLGKSALGYAVGKIELRVAVAAIVVGLAVHIAYVLALRRKENIALAAAVGRSPGDRIPDELWLWSRFYHNTNDPVLFVEKRTGPGYTVNFGHLRTWLMMAVFLILILLPLVLNP